MAYLLGLIIPQTNGLGCTGHAYAASEGTLDGKPHFWFSTNIERAIRFNTTAEADAFNERYIEAGELSSPMDIIKQ